MISFISSVIKSNYKLIIFGVLFGLVPYLQYQGILTRQSDKTSSPSIADLNKAHEYVMDHHIRKREGRADKYMYDYQGFNHPEYMDFNYHNQLPFDENNKDKEAELQEQFGQQKEEPEIIITKKELEEYNGEPESKGLYLSIMGMIYDVSKGVQHYGPGGGYNFFAGRDASNSFITGNFEKVTPDIDNVLLLTAQEIYSLNQWKSFYDKEYKYKGKLIGRFYDSNGNETPFYKEVYEQIEKAIREREFEEKMEEQYPACNMEWNPDAGTRVWCTTMSGGKKRDWVGLPRKYYPLGATTFRCACIRVKDLGNSSFKEYENCSPTSTSCTYIIA